MRKIRNINGALILAVFALVTSVTVAATQYMNPIPEVYGSIISKDFIELQKSTYAAAEPIQK